MILQIKAAFLDWQFSVQQIQRAKGALEVSQVQLELVQKRYEAGRTNIVKLEDAQRH